MAAFAARRKDKSAIQQEFSVRMSAIVAVVGASSYLRVGTYNVHNNSMFWIVQVLSSNPPVLRRRKKVEKGEGGERGEWGRD